MYFPAQGTSNDYGTEYDGNTGYWCHLFNGTCIHSEPAAAGRGQPPAGFTTSSQVAAYGETNDTRVQMGSDQAHAVLLSAITYKPNTTGGFNYVFAPADGDYGACNANPCGYDRNQGNSGGILWVTVWTNFVY